MQTYVRLFQTAAIASLLFLASCPRLGEMMRHFGFTELRPPSQTLIPGTMVWVEKTKPFKAGIICTQATSLGPKFKPLKSPTSSKTLQRAANVKVDMGADILELIKAKTNIHALRSLSVELTNPVVYELTDMDVLAAMPNRDPICAQAISNRVQAGFPVTMISKALMADVVYSVQWNQGIELDAQAKADILSGLSPHLGVTQGTVREDGIKGKGLFWGIQDDIYLSKLALGLASGVSAANPQGLPPVRTDPAPERLIEVDAVPSIEEGIDTDQFEDEEDD